MGWEGHQWLCGSCFSIHYYDHYFFFLVVLSSARAVGWNMACRQGEWGVGWGGGGGVVFQDAPREDESITREIGGAGVPTAFKQVL